MKVETVVKNGAYEGIIVDVPPGIKLGDDHIALLEYRAARHGLNAMCDGGRIPTEALTPDAQCMVEINGAVAKYYETKRPDIIANFQTMRRRGDALGWESSVSLTDENGNPVPIFTFQR